MKTSDLPHGGTADSGEVSHHKDLNHQNLLLAPLSPAVIQVNPWIVLVFYNILLGRTVQLILIAGSLLVIRHSDAGW